jgi:hypothetical protein
MKEMHDKQIVPQDTTILRKDSVLISTDQVSQDTIINSSVISVTRDSNSTGNTADTGSSQYSVSLERMTGDSVPQRPINIINSEHSLRTVHDVLADEDVPYLLENDTNLIKKYNQLTKFGYQYYVIRDSSAMVYKENANLVNSKTIQKFREDNYSGNTPLYDLSPDWLMGIIIVSLIVLAWLKLFFHKFINQTVTSLWNFQLSKKELRDQNIFSRRVAFILNLNFIIIGGLFIYLVFSHFRINPFQLNPFPLYLSCTGLLTILLLIRQILIMLTGFVFNQQDNFMEYLHQILLINKNIGIFFIPLVICIAYMQDSIRIYLIITGIALLLFAYLLRFVKGIQIIIKKDVLLFYLILYLCTLEILPVVIYTKFFSSWL